MIQGGTLAHYTSTAVQPAPQPRKATVQPVQTLITTSTIQTTCWCRFLDNSKCYACTRAQAIPRATYYVPGMAVGSVDATDVLPTFGHVLAQNHRVHIHILCFGAVISGGGLVEQLSAVKRSAAIDFRSHAFQRRAQIPVRRRRSCSGVMEVPPHLCDFGILFGISMR